MRQIFLKDSNQDVLYKMQQAGFNVTTCGDCGKIKLQADLSVDELICDYCGMQSDICDFPDLYTV